MIQFDKNKDLLTDFLNDFHSITVGAYKVMNRLEDVPLVTGYQHTTPRAARLSKICSAWDTRAPL